MFTQQQNFHDFKENVKRVAPLKTQVHSRKGLASLSLNSFADTNIETKNKFDGCENELKSCQTFPSKTNSENKVEKGEIKAESEARTQVSSNSDEDSWSEIEEMHIFNEPDDDYEDILPQSERIQKADIDALFVNFTFTKYAEWDDDEDDDYLPSPSPVKEIEWIEPEFPLQLPHIDLDSALFDNTELIYIPI